jgi:hypothetical protein
LELWRLLAASRRWRLIMVAVAIYRRRLVWAAVFVLLVVGFPTLVGGAVAEEASAPLQVAAVGDDIEAASTFGSPNVPVVYVATGENFPDALAGGPPAGMQRGPVLLVRNLSIPTVTANELTRLNPDSIVVVGGSGVISDTVVLALGSFTSGTVTRLAGPDRYATAVAVSEAAYPNNGVVPGTTMRGVYGIDFEAQDAFDAGVDSLSFGFTLAAAPTGHFIAEGGTPPAECPGTATMPEADPGHLCVYETEGTNWNSVCITRNSPSWACHLTDSYGAGLYFDSTSTGRTFSVGTWAVTAP